MHALILDVGQASCAVVDIGSHRLAVFDCGGATDADALRVREHLLAYIENDDETRIAFLVISHLDIDHTSALDIVLAEPAIAERIESIVCNGVELRLLVDLLKRVVQPGAGITRNLTAYRGLRSIVRLARFIGRRARHNPYFHREICVPPGHDSTQPTVNLLQESKPEEVRLICLAPSQRLKDAATNALGRLRDERNSTLGDAIGLATRTRWNSAGIVITAELCGRRILFPGDATAETWRDIFDRVPSDILRTDIVVAWHHGAKLGRLDGVDYDEYVWRRILETTTPAAVIISHGCDNRYGHPHQETIACALKGRADVYCTRLKWSPRAISSEYESAFPAELVGMSLVAGDPQVRYLREDGVSCCGNIAVRIDCAASMYYVAPAADHYVERSSQTGCCLHEAGVEMSP